MGSLSDAQLEVQRARYGKIGVVEFSGHQLVFRKPSRDNARDYRRKKDSEAEKTDAMDQLAQATIIAFDGEEDVNRARVTFTEVFLEDYPLAMNSPKFIAVLSALAGLIEDEVATDLGKGASIKGLRLPDSPKGSTNGPAASSTTAP